MPESPSTAPAAPARNLAKRRLRCFGYAFLALAAGGLLLKPGAVCVRESELETGLRRPLPDIDRSDALSQNLAIFALGGLRSLAAEICSLDAISAWMAKDWERLERRWETVTTLAPNRPNYWISAARDMGVNAESAARNDRRLGMEERIDRIKAYRAKGMRFLEDGIANNPGSAALYCELGDFLADRFRSPQFSKAADAYHRAVELGAPAMYRRVEFFCLSRVRGREREAYALGRELFETPANIVPSLQVMLFVLQCRLGMPESERLGVEDLFGSEKEGRRVLESYLGNDLRFPVDGIRDYLETHPEAEPGHNPPGR